MHSVYGSSLSGQWAVVTGASKGIGQGIASAFVDAGANVVLVARGGADLEAARAELARPGPVVLTHRADTSVREDVDGLFAFIAANVPSLNIFVANAGSGVVTPFLDLCLEEWDRTLALNLTGTFQCCQAAARMMAAHAAPHAPTEAAAHPAADGGQDRAILVVSSIRAVGVRPGRLAYSATKAAVNQLVRSAAYELAPLGIRVNTLSPGITATPMALEGNPEIFVETSATVPMGRAGTPADMAQAALYLCSPQARFVTGANIVVDGGESLW